MTKQTRRVFLQQAAGAAAACSVSAADRAGRCQQPDSRRSRRLQRPRQEPHRRLQGSIGRALRLRLPRAWPWRPRISKRAMAASWIRVTDFRRLLDRKDIDAISIATPNHTHSLIAIPAVQAGKDVYVEKPISQCVWEGRQLVKAAEAIRTSIVQCGTQVAFAQGDSRSGRVCPQRQAWARFST